MRYVLLILAAAVAIAQPLPRPQCKAGNSGPNCIPTTDVNGNFPIGATMRFRGGAATLPTDGVLGDVAFLSAGSVGLYSCNSATCNASQWSVAGGSGSSPWVSDGAGGFNLMSGATVLANISSAGVLSLGDGTAPWNLTGLSDDAAPGAPAGANQFTAYVDRSDGAFKIHRNGAANPDLYNRVATLSFVSMTSVTAAQGTRYFAAGATQTTDSAAAIPAIVSGTAVAMRCNVGAAPGTGYTHTFTLYSGGSPTALTCQIANAATTCSDTAHTAALTEAALLSIKLDVSSSGTATSTEACYLKITGAQ